MDASELLETITQLIDQAEQGDIDPWDVKVIEVIDRFLELMAPEANRRGYETDLFQSGQAFLSASMLVLFKANTLMQMQAAEDAQEALMDEFLGEGEEDAFLRTARLPLERALRRRSAAMPPPKRRVTLAELIEQLQVMADQLKKVQQKEVIKPIRTRNVDNVRTMRQAIEMSHQENLSEVAGELEQLLYSSASEFALEQEWMNLEQLLELWTVFKKPTQTLSGDRESSKNSHKVGVFWALLLLSAQSKVELYQEDFYQELKIRLLAHPANTSKTDLSAS
ncbi:ScpA family protein [Calothrix sp. UHCC 0171]|uniref:ScpA family protein n=1 Tax=Calothrix sp. UHCC 0171 TaxID=3110245 RepID=UPI002B1EBC0B|nr:ScpA family protein [Calothrix sp. UHCC 0171]MEA5571391.1 ScpA family protein [Calothrix sp. UHCC 0171]